GLVLVGAGTVADLDELEFRRVAAALGGVDAPGGVLERRAVPAAVLRRGRREVLVDLLERALERRSRALELRGPDEVAGDREQQQDDDDDQPDWHCGAITARRCARSGAPPPCASHAGGRCRRSCSRSRASRRSLYRSDRR